MILMLIINVLVTNCNCDAILKIMPNVISVIWGVETCFLLWIFSKEKGFV